jgi:competence protein ComEC
LDSFPSLGEYLKTCLALSLIIALFTLLFFKHLHPILWTVLIVTATTLAGISYYTLKIESKSHILNTHLPISREILAQIKVKKVLPENPHYSYTHLLGQLIERAPEKRLKNGEYVFISIRTDNFDKTLFIPGNELKIQGLHTFLRNIKNASNRLKQKGIYSKITHVRSIELIKKGTKKRQYIAQLRKQFETTLALGLEDNHRILSVYKAMILGQKGSLYDDQKDQFIHTGTMHLFAISGLHIGIITLFIVQFFKLLQFPDRLIPFISLSLIFIFILVIESPPSALRAFVMIAIYWISLMIRRQSNPFSTLIVSALILLLIQPEQLFSKGFKLSYSVVGTLLLLGLPLNEWLQNRCRLFNYLPKESWSDLHKIADKSLKYLLLGMSISFSAWIGSMAFCIQLFGYVSTAALLANLLLIQLASLVILTGIVSLGLGLVQLSFISEFFNHSAWLIISIIDCLLDSIPNIPFPAIRTINGNTFPAETIQIAFFTLLISLYYLPKKKNILALMTPVFLLLITILTSVIYA